MKVSVSNNARSDYNETMMKQQDYDLVSHLALLGEEIIVYCSNAPKADIVTCPLLLYTCSHPSSIAFWIVVYVPQIAEIIYLQSGEGLSVLFLCIVSVH